MLKNDKYLWVLLTNNNIVEYKVRKLKYPPDNAIEDQDTIFILIVMINTSHFFSSYYEYSF